MMSLFFFNLIITNLNIAPLIISLYFLQMLIELKFLIFAIKQQGLKMFLFSFLGIQGINLGILLGFNLFIFTKLKKLLNI